MALHRAGQGSPELVEGPQQNGSVESFNGRLRDECCGSAWKKDPGSGVIGVEKGPLIPVV